MTSQNPAYASSRRMRLVLALHLAWLGLLCLLGAWWGRVLLHQAGRILELERMAGIAADSAAGYLKTQRMLFWESASFFLLLVVASAFLLWLYWRDQRRARSLQAFFASVTHELRTPLTSIRLQAESIAEGMPEDSSDATLVRRLLEDTARLESQVERTLELARVEGGGPVLTTSVALRPWIERAAAGWREAHGGRLDLRAEIDDSTVLADVAGLQVVFRNLIENSLRHARKEKVGVSIRARAADTGVEVLFEDDGPGFSGDASRLGTLFHKGASSQGAGVGLYLVRVLMERMDGEARFENAPGFRAVLRFRDGRSDG